MQKDRGFSLIELLIVVAIILIVAAIAIPNLLRSRIAANEAGGAATIRTLITDSNLYANTYPAAGYPANITVLGNAGATPCVASAASACMADSTLACAAQPCLKDNYLYSITGIGPGGGVPMQNFVAFGTPNGPNSAGKDFCGDSEGVVRRNFAAAPPTAALTTVAACEVYTPAPL